MARVVVIGPGAIGCAFAGAALQAGHEIAVAGRTRFDHLHVEHPDVIVDGPIDWLEPDLDVPHPFVMLATKAHQTEGAADRIGALCDGNTVLAVLQNGVEHLERVRPLVEPGTRIVPAMVACPSERSAPGRIHVTGRARLEVPADDAGAQFQQLFAGSFADVALTDDWVTAAWRKLVLNAAGGGIGALVRRGNDVLHDDTVGELFLAIAREVIAVARAEGAALDDEVAPQLLVALRGSISSHMPSIVVDRIEGRPTEWQARNEVVVRRAAGHGIPVPLNAMLTTLLQAGEPVQQSKTL